MPLPRLVSWRRVDVDGVGIARFADDGIDGHEIVLGRVSHAVYFGCEVDAQWRTRYVSLGITHRSASYGTQLEVDERGRWTAHGRRRASLDGCIDVDVAATPATNTLPIRRVDLRVGRAVTIPVAWVDVPSLRVRRVDQTYRRVADDVYEYSTATYGPARLTVDGDGIVIDYEGFAARVR
jgi:uncharacterized protein